MMTNDEILAGMRARRDALDRERAALNVAIEAFESITGDLMLAEVATKTNAQQIVNSMLAEHSARKEPKPSASARPTVAPTGMQSRILTALKESGSLSPGALATKLGVSVSHLYHHTKPLLMSGRLVGSGAREGRRLSLPRPPHPSR
jgi:DNA-binding transcriptional ArsR family regulator